MNGIKGLLKHCMDKNNLKPELDCILIDGNKLICTDTKQLLVLEFKEDFCAKKDEAIMLFEKLPKGFTKSQRPKQMVDILDANNGIVEDLGFKLGTPFLSDTGKAKFPDYERIIGTSPKEKRSEFIFYGDRNDDDILLFKSTILNNALFDGRFLAKFAQLLLKMRVSFDITIEQDDANMPLRIYAKCRERAGSILESITYIVMPIVIDEKDRYVA